GAVKITSRDSRVFLRSAKSGEPSLRRTESRYTWDSSLRPLKPTKPIASPLKSYTANSRGSNDRPHREAPEPRHIVRRREGRRYDPGQGGRRLRGVDGRRARTRPIPVRRRRPCRFSG